MAALEVSVRSAKYLRAAQPCQHPTPRLVGAGLMVCDDCDSIRGADRTWRVRDREV